MRRAVTRKVLCAKSKTSLPRPRVVSSGAGGMGTLYNRIVAAKGTGRYCVVRRVGGIGDVIMALPTLKQLKTEFPKIHLTFAIDMHTTGNNVYYELCKNLPYVDALMDARFVQRNAFDALVDISSVCIRYENAGLPTMNRIDIFARAIGIPRLYSSLPTYVVEPHEAQWARVQVATPRSSFKKIVVLHTASMEPKRCWSVEKYLDIVKRAQTEHPSLHFIVLDFNGKYDKWHTHPNVSDYSRTALREMAALINEADFFIGPDSGPMHLAGALQKKSIVIFGSIPPEARINHYLYHEGMRLDGLPCLGCWYKPCPIGEKCMKDLPYERVYNRMIARLL